MVTQMVRLHGLTKLLLPPSVPSSALVLPGSLWEPEVNPEAADGGIPSSQGGPSLHRPWVIKFCVEVSESLFTVILWPQLLTSQAIVPWASIQ